MSRPHRFIPKPYRDLARLYLRRGWRITPTGSGHARWRTSIGEIVITSSTPDGKTTVIKDRARLRKAALNEENA